MSRFSRSDLLARYRARIARGEPILRERISERAVLSANLPADARAITVPVNAVTSVAGFVTPGDVVDVLLTGLVISGGSEGLHKLAKVWDNATAKLAGESGKDGDIPSDGSAAPASTNGHPTGKTEAKR